MFVAKVLYDVVKMTQKANTSHNVLMTSKQLSSSQERNVNNCTLLMLTKPQ